MPKKKAITFLIMLILIPLGISTKYYQGIYSNWVNSSLGGIFYVTFGVLLLSLFFKAKAWKLSTIAFVLTSLIEILQLSKLPILQIIRSNWVGRLILGTSFVWSDFIYYVIGAIVGYFILIYLEKIVLK